MKKPVLSIVLLGAVCSGFVAGMWHNQRQRASAAGFTGRTVLFYVDPMHPTYRSDRPGTAPDCGMQLEPVYADAGASVVHRRGQTPAGTIAITPGQQQLLGVRVSRVESAAGTARLRLYGRVAPDETRQFTINVGIDGFIRDVAPLTTGSRVRKHDWLATFSAPEARAPIQGYLVALDVLDRTKKSAENPVAVDLAAAGVQQAVDRLLTLGMSSVQVEEIGRTRQVPANLRITSPAEGFVVARTISTGQKFDRGDELYRLADLRRVWINADVFGRTAELVKPGMVAQISVPGRSAAARAVVSASVLPQFDEAAQSMRLRLETDNPDYVLRPGMTVDVDLPLALPAALSVPADAVMDAGLTKTVFLERTAGVFEPRQVETGWRLADRIEIRKGLAAGDRIVVAGTFLLDSESRLRQVSAERARP